MQVTTGNQSFSSQLLARLSLGIGLAVMLLTVFFIWVYGLLEFRDLKNSYASQHHNMAVGFVNYLEKKAAITSPELGQETIVNLQTKFPGVSADYLLLSFFFSELFDKQLVSIKPTSSIIWNPAASSYVVQKGPPIDGAYPTIVSTDLNSVNQVSPKITLNQPDLSKSILSTYWTLPSISTNGISTKGLIVEFRTDVSEEFLRVQTRRYQMFIIALALEGALIGFMFWMAKRGEDRLRASERDQIAMESELFFLAHYDTLTHLPNRTLFWERLDASTIRAGRLGKSVALILVDLHQFTKINDQMGRSVGDQCLNETAKRIQAASRAADLVCRIGADEFVVVLEDLDPQKAKQATERLATALQTQFAPAFFIDSGSTPITLTIGCGASFFPQDGTTSEELLAHAEAALVSAKKSKQFLVIYEKSL